VKNELRDIDEWNEAMKTNANGAATAVLFTTIH
jgi:hypothetical protein